MTNSTTEHTKQMIIAHRHVHWVAKRGQWALPTSHVKVYCRTGIFSEHKTL